jgi:hypothetical protein
VCGTKDGWQLSIPCVIKSMSHSRLAVTCKSIQPLVIKCQSDKRQNNGKLGVSLDFKRWFVFTNLLRSWWEGADGQL